ncbi:MAG: hypothetical protein MUC39_01940 [Candidatus Omnitrophica bacterium]|jgi:hypothetical protein|nr:hypothetical protein [Candidatus Omnitrophota bacterium]
MKYLFSLILAVFLSAAMVSPALAKEKPSSKLQTQKLDLNADKVKEIITMEDKFDTDGFSVITIARPKADKIGSFTVPGRFKAIEFADLYGDGAKQIAVYFEGKDASNHLVLYGIKNNRISRIFGVDSACDIEGDFSTVLARITIDKPVCEEGSCYCPEQPEHEIWIWTGEKFIRER